MVDDWSQTAVPSIYAVGDVTDRAALTPVAIREGHAFADTVFGGRPVKADHGLIPTAVFTQPEIGTVGLTRGARRASSGRVEIYRPTFRPMQNVLAGRDERMLMKLVVDAADRRVLGCHIVGHGAGEMIQLAGDRADAWARPRRISTAPSPSIRRPPRNWSRCGAAAA